MAKSGLRLASYMIGRGKNMPVTKAEDDMKLTYDIFRKFAEDGPIWIETVQGIETCKSRLLDLVQRNPGEYFAFDPLHSRVVANSSNTQGL
jgi:hypothetical protein